MSQVELELVRTVITGQALADASSAPCGTAKPWTQHPLFISQVWALALENLLTALLHSEELQYCTVRYQENARPVCLAERVSADRAAPRAG